MPVIRPAVPKELPLLVAIDDDASALYAVAGLSLTFPPDHPFVVAERRRWLRCIEQRAAYLALEGDVACGFAALERLDGMPHLEQLSVRASFGRRGIGTALLKVALAWAGGPLTLTTYAHLTWNAPWYERMGFRPVRESELSPELRARMDEERAVLPLPERRVAMHRD